MSILRNNSKKNRLWFGPRIDPDRDISDCCSSYLLYTTFLWTEEICRFTLNWLVMLGSALAVRNSDHFDIDILSNLTPRGREIQFWVVNSLIILSALLFTVFGWGLLFLVYGVVHWPQDYQWFGFTVHLWFLGYRLFYFS